MQKKEPLEKSGRAEPWGQEEPVSRSASWRHDFARLFFFLMVYLRPRSTEKAKEALLVV